MRSVFPRGQHNYYRYRPQFALTFVNWYAISQWNWSRSTDVAWKTFLFNWKLKTISFLGLWHLYILRNDYICRRQLPLTQTNFSWVGCLPSNTDAKLANAKTFTVNETSFDARATLLLYVRKSNEHCVQIECTNAFCEWHFRTRCLVRPLKCLQNKYLSNALHAIPTAATKCRQHIQRVICTYAKWLARRILSM